MGSLLGYARVSTAEQHAALQVDELTRPAAIGSTPTTPPGRSTAGRSWMRCSPSSGQEIPWWRGRLQLGEALDTQNVRAAYSNGALTLTIPVTAAAQPRRIEVQHGQGQQQIDLTGQLPVADAAGSTIQGAQQ